MKNIRQRIRNYLLGSEGSPPAMQITRENSTLQTGMQVEVTMNEDAPESLKRNLLRKTEGRITRVDQREGLGTKFYLHNADQYFHLKYYTVHQV